MTQFHNDFIQGIDAGLTYWQGKADRLDEPTINNLNMTRKNLILILEFGLQWPQTWQKAAELLIHVFPVFQLRNHWFEGQSLLQLAQKHAPEKETALYMRLLLQLGHVQRLQGNLAQAHAIHADALEKVRSMQDILLLKGMLVELTFDNLLLNHLGIAKQAGQEAVLLAAEVDVDSGLHIDALRGLGRVLIRTGEVETAVSYLQEAVAQARQTERIIILARSLSDLGWVLARLGKRNQADSAYREAEGLLESTQYKWDKALLLSNMGTFYFDAEDWQASEVRFRQAHSFHFSFSGDAANQTIVLNNLGNALFKQGKLEEAESYLRASLDLRPQVGGDVGWGNSLGTLAELLVRQGRKEEAIPIYQTAIEKLKPYPGEEWGQRLLHRFRKQLKKLV